MSVDYAKLVQQGRAKAPGVPWSLEEAHARYELNIPAEFVRDGVLTLKEYEAAKVNPGEDVRMEQLPMADLVKEAQSEGIDSNPQTDKFSLIGLIKRARARRKEKKENEGKAHTEDENSEDKSPEDPDPVPSQDGGGDKTPKGDEGAADAQSGGSNEGGEKVQRSAETQ